MIYPAVSWGLSFPLAEIPAMSATLLVCCLEHLLWIMGVLIGKMPIKSENPGMWINPKSNLNGGRHSSTYGEGQNTHNSRFLELADVVLSLNEPAKRKVKAAAAGRNSEK
ncbi:MAG: hypothetical protein ACXVIO_06950 [Candidatus Angelobacter sp.]